MKFLTIKGTKKILPCAGVKAITKGIPSFQGHDLMISEIIFP
jgi:hypothetical protein